MLSGTRTILSFSLPHTSTQTRTQTRAHCLPLFLPSLLPSLLRCHPHLCVTQLEHGLASHSVSFTLVQEFVELFSQRPDIELVLKAASIKDRLFLGPWPQSIALTVNQQPLTPTVSEEVEG
jgi:hypothetical protein